MVGKGLGIWSAVKKEFSKEFDWSVSNTLRISVSPSGSRSGIGLANTVSSAEQIACRLVPAWEKKRFRKLRQGDQRDQRDEGDEGDERNERDESDEGDKKNERD